MLNHLASRHLNIRKIDVRSLNTLPVCLSELSSPPLPLNLSLHTGKSITNTQFVTTVNDEEGDEEEVDFSKAFKGVEIVDLRE